MRRYIEHIKTKETHERRTHAMQLSGMLVAVVFLVWITTIGWRFAVPVQSDADSSQTAAVVNSQTGDATLYVATTSDQ